MLDLRGWCTDSLTRDGHVFTVSGTRMIWNGEKYSRVRAPLLTRVRLHTQVLTVVHLHWRRKSQVWVDEQIPKVRLLPPRLSFRFIH